MKALIAFIALGSVIGTSSVRPEGHHKKPFDSDTYQHEYSLIASNPFHLANSSTTSTLPYSAPGEVVSPSWTKTIEGTTAQNPPNWNSPYMPSTGFWSVPADHDYIGSGAVPIFKIRDYYFRYEYEHGTQTIGSDSRTLDYKHEC